MNSEPKIIDNKKIEQDFFWLESLFLFAPLTIYEPL